MTRAAGSKNLFPNFGTLSGEPVECSYTDAYFRGDPLPAGTLRPKCGNPPRIHDSFRPAEPLAFGLRIPQSSPDALGNQAAFQFRDAAQHGKDHSARWRSCVE